MRLRKYAVVLALFLIPICIHASQQGKATASVKIAKGYLLVWNQPGLHFTLEVEGGDVSPVRSKEKTSFVLGNRMILAVESAAIGQFLDSAEREKLDDQSILAAYRDWKIPQVEDSLLGNKLKVQSTPQKLGDGSDALLWRFEMPEMPHSVRSGAASQIYLTMIRSGHVIILIGVVRGSAEEAMVQRYLTDTSLTLKLSPGVINVPESQKPI